MKVPENAREQLTKRLAVDPAEDYFPEDRWIAEYALRALDYEAASGGVTEEMVAVAKARLHEGNAHSRLSAADVRRALLAVAPLLSAAARRKALEEVEDAAHDAIHGAIYEMGECERVKSVVKDAIRALGRPA